MKSQSNACGRTSNAALMSWIPVSDRVLPSSGSTSQGIVKLLGMILSPGNSRHFPDEISTDLTVRRPSPYR